MAVDRMANDGRLTVRTLALPVGASVLLAALTLALLPLLGSTHIDYARAWAGVSPDKEILFEARLPRVLLSALAGGALATIGVLFQSLLRDALAEPYTMGVASGASLGAVLAICLHLPAVWLAGMAGAGLTLLLVMTIAGSGRRLSSFTLLLAGVTINSIAIAVILFLQSVASFSQSFAIVRWLMGGISEVPMGVIGGLAAVIVPVEIVLFWQGRQWNVLAVGEQWAAARGVSPVNLLRLGFVLGSLVVGAVTSITGPIGFLGLIVPHTLRLMVGADHRVLLPCSFFAGGAFLAICDTIARTALAPTEVPVGVITAMLGGPFFIWLLANRRSSLWL